VTEVRDARSGDRLARPLLTLVLLAGALFLFVLFYSAGEPRRKARLLEEETARRHARLLPLAEMVFVAHCAECHGGGGGGSEKGPALRSRSFLDAVTDETIAETIRAGRKGTEMRAWGKDHGGHFGEEEIEGLVAFIRAWQASAPGGASDPRHAGGKAGE